MKEIGSEFWDIPIGTEKNSLLKNATWFISGRAAFRAILKQILLEKSADAIKVALPSYLCESMIEPLEKEKIAYRFYPVAIVNHALQYDFSSISDCNIVVILDYFGFETLNVNPPQGKIIIRDLTHSIFTKKYDDADYYFGSLRKWAGFISGGFAFRKGGAIIEPTGYNETYNSLRKQAMSLKSGYISNKTESKSYLELFHNAEALLDDCEILSCESSDIESFRALDMEHLKNVRRENAQILIDGLREYCLFKEIKDNDCPLCVPILYEKRDELRNYLIADQIYCPIHWPKPSKVDNALSTELYKKELSLVCDQRYTKEDMARAINAVLTFIKKNKMLSVITIAQSQKWDEIVKSFKDYDVYYLSGYVKAFQIHGDGEPLLFLFESDTCRGINVVMKRDIALDKCFEGKLETNKYFDFATPYGYGGWLIEGNDSSSLFNEYEKWCQEHNIVSEFVRYHPILKNHVYSLKAYHVIPLGETVAIDTTDKELIWANFNPKNRNVIRKAINSGVQIKHGLSNDLFDAFVRIYNGTMDKDHAESYYYFEKQFYDSIRDDLKDHATVFYAELDGVIIAASIMLFVNGRLNYHLSGSLKEYQHLAPTNMLLWKAAEWGNEIGCKTFHLGGGVGSAEDGLFKFKRAFYRGELNRYHVGKKIFNEEIYNRLVDMRHKESNSDYFPEYRG